MHCAVEYLPKYLPSRRVIRKKIEEKAAVSKDKGNSIQMSMRENTTMSQYGYKFFLKKVT